MLSPPTIGAMTGVAIVLLIGIVARRSEQRAQERRLRLIQERIERRQEALANRSATDGGRDRDASREESRDE